MNNLFLSETKDIISEKYDIKGSYIKRNASYPRDGDKATCTHCNKPFIYYRKDSRYIRVGKSGAFPKGPTAEALAGSKCGKRMGGHEPNVVMKDNDLRDKLNLAPEDAKFLREQLKKDSEFLQSIRVMDYSLLSE